MESSSHKEQPPLTPGVQGLESQHSVRALARYLFTEGTGTRALGVEAPGSDTLQGQFRAKLGIKMKNPQAFGYATNL